MHEVYGLYPELAKQLKTYGPHHSGQVNLATLD